MAHLRSLPLTSLRWQEALNRHDQTQLKQLIQARFAHQHNATVHHFLPRLFGLLAGVIGRVDRTIARSGPPQIRACAIDALGSSTVRFTRRTLGARFSLAVTGVSATVALPSPTGTILSVIAS